MDNTLAFLNGFEANNMLLYGDRGTGKSSTVKALLNEYAPMGLRMIEVPKEYLAPAARFDRLSVGAAHEVHHFHRRPVFFQRRR